jgi:hypothetical protein
MACACHDMCVQQAGACSRVCGGGRCRLLLQLVVTPRGAVRPYGSCQLARIACRCWRTLLHMCVSCCSL